MYLLINICVVTPHPFTFVKASYTNKSNKHALKHMSRDQKNIAIWIFKLKFVCVQMFELS